MNMSYEGMNKASSKIKLYFRIISSAVLLLAMFLIVAGPRSGLPVYMIMIVPFGIIVLIIAYIVYKAYSGVFYTLKKDVLVIDRYGQTQEIRYPMIRGAEEVTYTPETAGRTTAYKNEVEIRYIDHVGLESSTIVCPSEEKEFLSMLRERMAESGRIPWESDSPY